MQNSLDTQSGSGPVRVRFALSSIENSSEDKLQRYFNGLLPHLKAAGADFDPYNRPLSYIIIEDFGTKGLTGDPDQTTDNEDNNFYWFFRNVGRSGKGEDKGGSYGNTKPGVVAKGSTEREKPGTLYRLFAVFQQLEFTYDIFNMPCERMIELLPPEFDELLNSEKD